jgi:hypothetical protein
MATMRIIPIGLSLLLVVAASCSDDDVNNGAEDDGTGLSGTTGQECQVADDCFSDVAGSEDIMGTSNCLDRVEGGYCTHECTANTDCCTVDDVCPVDTTHVCGPFESTGLMLCFISCENADVGNDDPDDYCGGFHADFVCRSTGGGANNQKVCVPGGGGACDNADNCSADFAYCCENSLGDNRCYNAADAEGRTCLNDPPL